MELAPEIRLWFSAFFWTQLLEVPVLTFALLQTPRLQAADLRARHLRAVVLAFTASAATHPIVWFVLPALLPQTRWGVFVGVETFAVVAETLFLAALEVRRPWAWALGANALSATFGLITYELFGWFST